MMLRPAHRRATAVPQEELLVIVAAFLAMLGVIALGVAVIFACGYG